MEEDEPVGRTLKMGTAISNKDVKMEDVPLGGSYLESPRPGVWTATGPLEARGHKGIVGFASLLNASLFLFDVTGRRTTSPTLLHRWPIHPSAHPSPKVLRGVWKVSSVGWLFQFGLASAQTAARSDTPWETPPPPSPPPSFTVHPLGLVVGVFPC